MMQLHGGQKCAWIHMTLQEVTNDLPLDLLLRLDFPPLRNIFRLLRNISSSARLVNIHSKFYQKKGGCQWEHTRHCKNNRSVHNSIYSTNYPKP